MYYIPFPHRTGASVLIHINSSIPLVNFLHSVDGFLVDLHHSVPVLDQGRNISAAQWMGEICKSLVLACPYKQEDFAEGFNVWILRVCTLFCCLSQ